MTLGYCQYCSISLERIDGIWPSFAYVLMLTRSTLELLHINILYPQQLYLCVCVLVCVCVCMRGGGYTVFILSVRPFIRYVLVSERGGRRGVFNKHCLLTFLEYWAKSCEIWKSLWVQVTHIFFSNFLNTVKLCLETFRELFRNIKWT